MSTLPQFDLEPPRQPSHYDFCDDRSEEVFQNVTNASVPPLESATPLSPNEPFNRRNDLIDLICLQFKFRINYAA